MKAIKITASNVSIITQALADVNGKADAHTLTSGSRVVEIAAEFEAQLIKLVGTKKMAPGAKAVWVSGDALPAAYKYSRIVTAVQLERKGSHWFLTAVAAWTAYGDSKAGNLVLTDAQDDAAIAVLRKQYRRATPAITAKTCA